MPEQVNEEKTDNLIDVGEADEKATEIDLDKKAEGEVNAETDNKDSDKSDDSSEKSGEQLDDSPSKPETEKETSQEVKEEPTEQQKEMGEYSEGVQKRIAKLTKKMREAERQKEEAVSYARRVMRERDEIGKQATELDHGYTSEMEGRIKSSLAALRLNYPFHEKQTIKKLR